MVNPIQVYEDWVLFQDVENKKGRKKDNPDKFEASSAGLCMKKHYYRAIGAEQKGADIDGLRIMRLGTIMGEDFANAIEHYEQCYSDHKFYQETLLKSDKLGVAGHLDLLIVDDKGNGALYDWKTANSFKYKSIFKGSNDTNNNALQVGTYAIMAIEMGLCKKITHLGLLYYSKNDSKMQELGLSLDVMQEAQEYWDKSRILVDTHMSALTEPEWENGSVPVYKWECGRYCNYSKICNCPLNKEYEGGKL